MRLSIPKHALTYVFLIIATLFVVLPLLTVLSQSLMTNQEVNRWPPQIIPVGDVTISAK